jgi:double-stranded uracil-DNA glycosylase
MRNPVLPDLLAPDLKIVFCGTAPGHVSALQRAYYAHPHNKFWRILYETGLTPRQLAPEDYRELLDYGIGLTDIAKFDKGLDKDLKAHSLGHKALLSLRERIESFQPNVLAFTSMTGGAKFFKERRACGLQPETLGRTRIWILPSTSGLACGSWDEKIWHKLARAAQKAAEQAA